MQTLPTRRSSPNMCLICLELKSVFLGLRGGRIIKISTIFWTCVFFHSDDPTASKGIQGGLLFIANHVLFVYTMHIKVSLHHLIKWLDFFIMEYHISVFLIGEHQSSPNLKHNFAYFHFQIFLYVGRYLYISGLVLYLSYTR